jgi:hypothetical protein
VERVTGCGEAWGIVLVEGEIVKIESGSYFSSVFETKMDEEKLIPELADWRKLNGDQFSIEDWVVGEGDIKFAIGYSILFWPEFIEYDDCVILKSHFDSNNFESWKNTEYVFNYAQIESVLNHIHILDLFGADEKKNEVNYEQILFLGNRLCEIYKAKLKLEYPEKKFIFDFNGNERLAALQEYEITFYQEKNVNRKTKYDTQ